jgi:hypothetical protein
LRNRYSPSRWVGIESHLVSMSHSRARAHTHTHTHTSDTTTTTTTSTHSRTINPAQAHRRTVIATHNAHKSSFTRAPSQSNRLNVNALTTALSFPGDIISGVSTLTCDALTSGATPALAGSDAMILRSDSFRAGFPSGTQSPFGPGMTVHSCANQYLKSEQQSNGCDEVCVSRVHALRILSS